MSDIKYKVQGPEFRGQRRNILPALAETSQLPAACLRGAPLAGRGPLARRARSAWGACLTSALLTAMLSGCTGILSEGSSLIPWFGGEAALPTRVSAIWSETTLQQPGRPGIRGIGGRVMFYKSQNKDPIIVDGTLTVYAYDKTVKKNVEPARKYVFPADQLARHYSKSDLGHTYSFWLPWGKTDGPPKQLTLIARFEPIGGGAVLSDPANQHLPGISPEPHESPRASGEPPSDPYLAQKGPVQPVQHLAAIRSDPTRSHSGPRSAPARETITIDVPASFVEGRAPPRSVPIETLTHSEPADLKGQEPVSGRKIPDKTAVSTKRVFTASQGVAESSDDSPPSTDSAQTEGKLPLAADLHRTRRRLQAWLSARRPPRRVDPRGESETKR